jgi:predicted O-methyltransferase YrrM
LDGGGNYGNIRRRFHLRLTPVRLVQQSVLKGILQTGSVIDAAGESHKLHSQIDEDEGRMISALIERHGFDRTIEIGCAYGISSLYICQALSTRPSPAHTIIDPYQSTQWQGIGVSNLKRAGVEFFRLIEEPSELAAPMLLREGATFQFALIDGFHTFDQTLLDFYYLNRLLEEGGVVVVDDLGLPAVNKAVRYVVNYPTYVVIAGSPTHSSRKSGAKRVIDYTLRTLARLLPGSYAAQVFNDAWLWPGRFSLNASGMIALQKTGPDNRSWDWFVPF